MQGFAGKEVVKVNIHKKYLLLFSVVLSLTVLSSFLFVGEGGVGFSYLTGADNINPMIVSLFVLSVSLVALMFTLRDISRRKTWEKSVSDSISVLGRGQSRIMQEVAINRSDIEDIKFSLASTAKALESQSAIQKEMSAIEARMIKSLAGQLENIGKRQQLESSKKYDKATEKILSGRGNEIRIARSDSDNRNFKELNTGVADYSNTVILELLRHSIQNRKLEMFVHPVYSSNSRKKTVYFELLGRIKAKAGLYVPAERYMKLAEENDLTASVDRLMLINCLRLLGEKENSGRVFFMNIDSKTLADSGFMNDLLVFLSKNRNMSRNIVFEMKERDFYSMNTSVFNVARGLSQLGCRFSIDHVCKRNVDLSSFDDLNVCFLKLDIGRISKYGKGEEYFRSLRCKLENAGIKPILEKIEDKKDVEKFIKYGGEYGQGYYFARPVFHANINSLVRNKPFSDSEIGSLAKKIGEKKLAVA